jgi:hypothetical protein
VLWVAGEGPTEANTTALLPAPTWISSNLHFHLLRRVLLWVNVTAASVVMSTGPYFLNIPTGAAFGAQLRPLVIAKKVDSRMHPGSAELVWRIDV